MNTGTGFKSTLFSAFSDERLYSFFREESWNSLDESTKQQLCQEVVNREAQFLGMVRAPDVRFSRDIGNNYGVSGGNQIRLNARFFIDEQSTAIDKDGNSYNINFPDGNLQVLHTLFHENQHTYQEQITDNEIEIDDPETEIQYRANDFTRTLIHTENGDQIGSQYLSNPDNSTAGYYAYYLQSTERDANLYAEKKTGLIREMLTEKYGDEHSFQINRANEKVNGYQATLEKAKMEFGNENIEQEINKSLVNHRFNTTYPVDPKVDKLVEHEMVLSYQALERDKAIQAEQNEVFKTAPPELHNVAQNNISTENFEQVTRVVVSDENGIPYHSSETVEDVSVGITFTAVSNNDQDFGSGISNGNDGGMDSGDDNGMGM